LLHFFWEKIHRVAGLVPFLLLVMAVASYGAEKEADRGNPHVRIAIIPFQTILPETTSSKTVFCPLCGAGYFGGKIEKGAENVVEGILINKLQAFKEVEIIPVDKVAGIYKLISAETLKGTLFDILKKVGTELDADEIVLGYVFRYEERIGYDYAVEKPASVAFEINFINTKTGRIVWRGVFDKTQKSLMEDVLQISSFYKGGGKWQNARDLSKQGMNEIFEKFSIFER